MGIYWMYGYSFSIKWGFVGIYRMYGGKYIWQNALKMVFDGFYKMDSIYGGTQ